MIQRDDPYVASRAWSRALVFFVVAGALPAALLVVPRLLHGPPVARDGVWALMAAATLVVVLVGYVVVWPRGTFTEDRPRLPGLQASFGMVWGLTMGTVFTSMWIVAQHLTGSRWMASAATWVVASAFQGLWHQFYWDHKVSPPHNVTRFNIIKVGAGHVPNMTLCMIMLGLRGDVVFVIAMQVIALTSSALAMRFPPPSYVRDPSLDVALPALEGR